jgi:Zn-dependent peptidase ImmA (M78 family)/transcriptional regulator with XRE-family HTH domain
MNVNINGACLVRLRSNRNITTEDLASRTGIAFDDMRELERAGGELSTKELEKIASVLKLSWYAFLDDELEAARSFGNDNRSTRNKQHEHLDVETQKVMEDVVYLLELVHEVNPDATFDIPVYGKGQLSPEGHAKHLRKELGIDTDHIANLGDDYAVWRYWKDTLGSTGLYIFERSWNTKSVRAFSISRNNKAAAVVSTKDIPTARLFSLLHEIYHLINKQSSICDIGFTGSNNVEAGCNRFAASFLMPEEEFNTTVEALGYVKNSTNDIDEEDVKKFQKRFKVSRLSVYRRLLTLSYISNTQYTKIQNGYGEYELMKKSSGGNADVYYRSRLNGVGLRYAAEMFNAYSSGVLTAVSVARVFNVRVSQLNTISKLVGGNGRTG